MKSLSKKLLFITNALLLCITFSFFVSANQDGILPALEEKPMEKFSVTDENDEKIIISIINFGRSNPFSPYVPKKETKNETDLYEIPYPPTLEESDKVGYELLSNSLVNGILYDPNAKSVAIVNIEGKDYMVHAGDSVMGIAVETIQENSVILKYNANTYKVAVGEVIEGELIYDPVNRKQKIFAETGYRLPDLKMEGPVK